MPMLEVEDFVHPFDDSPTLWKMYFRAKRFLYLVAVFLPCVTVSGIGKMTGSEGVRAYGLELLVKAFDAAGCGLQKFAQWLSMRPDMIAPDIIQALSSLREDTPAHNIEHTRAMLKESFGLDLEVVFEEFDEKPVASGTVAQVHRGRLREEYAVKANIRLPNGELAREVAVKVRHPNVLAETWCDMDLIYTFIQATDLLTVPFKKDDFLSHMQRQVDFKREAQNLLQFGENFKQEVKSGIVSFPIVSVGMLSNCVLLESWASGQSVSNIMTKVEEKVEAGLEIVEEGLQKSLQKTKLAIKKTSLAMDELADEMGAEMAQTKRELAATLFDISIKMFLRDNLVHGDLHSGNVIFDQNLDNLTIIDAGLTTCLDEEWVRKDFKKFLQALCLGNVEQIVGKIMDFHVELDDTSLNAASVKGTNVVTSSNEKERALALDSLHQDIEQAVALFVDPAGSVRAPDGGPISLGDLVGSLMYSVQRHGVCLRSDVASSLMTMGINEGLIRSLDPDFDMVQKALPYFIEYGR